MGRATITNGPRVAVKENAWRSQPTTSGWVGREAVPAPSRAGSLTGQGVLTRQGVLAQQSMDSEDGAMGVALCEEDVLRAQLYNFVGRLLSAPPDGDLLRQIAALEGDDTPIGVATTALARLAAGRDAPAIEREFHQLFIGLGRGELLPYASYYLTGFLNEKPLARLRTEMSELGIALSDTVSEPEDNIASLCEMMGGLITGRFGAPADLVVQQRFFNTHIGPWAGHFFTDLERAEQAVFYAPVGTLGRLLMDVEQEAFRMAA